MQGFGVLQKQRDVALGFRQDIAEDGLGLSVLSSGMSF
jgi:hypothetical protein